MEGGAKQPCFLDCREESVSLYAETIALATIGNNASAGVSGSQDKDGIAC